MSVWRRDRFRQTFMGAAVYPGDHGIEPYVDDRQCVGLLEFTERLRWVPEQGEGWSLPIRLIEVESPRRTWRDRGASVILALPDGGTVNVFGRQGGGAIGSVTRAGGSISAPMTADIRRELISRGAADVSGPTPTEVDAKP